jgi:hypothetical protein
MVKKAFMRRLPIMPEKLVFVNQSERLSMLGDTIRILTLVYCLKWFVVYGMIGNQCRESQNIPLAINWHETEIFRRNPKPGMDWVCVYYCPKTIAQKTQSLNSYPTNTDAEALNHCDKEGITLSIRCPSGAWHRK